MFYVELNASFDDPRPISLIEGDQLLDGEESWIVRIYLEAVEKVSRRMDERMSSREALETSEFSYLDAEHRFKKIMKGISFERE